MKDKNTEKQKNYPTFYMSPDTYLLLKEDYQKNRPTPKGALENFKQELFKSFKIPQFVDWLSKKIKWIKG